MLARHITSRHTAYEHFEQAEEKQNRRRLSRQSRGANRQDKAQSKIIAATRN